MPATLFSPRPCACPSTSQWGGEAPWLSPRRQWPRGEASHAAESTTLCPPSSSSSSSGHSRGHCLVARGASCVRQGAGCKGRRLVSKSHTRHHSGWAEGCHCTHPFHASRSALNFFSRSVKIVLFPDFARWKPAHRSWRSAFERLPLEG